MDLAACESALYRLLQAQLRTESLTAARDLEISKIQQQFAPKISKQTEIIEALEAEVEAFYVSNRAELEANGQKSVQMAHGTIGMRTPGSPALVPVNDTWTWEAIRTKVVAKWAQKFLLPPTKRPLDKNKLKRTLSEAELKACGMRLETADKFYYDLNRPKEAISAV